MAIKTVCVCVCVSRLFVLFFVWVTRRATILQRNPGISLVMKFLKILNFFLSLDLLKILTYTIPVQIQRWANFSLGGLHVHLNFAQT